MDPSREQRDVALAVPCVGEEEWQALRAPLESGWLTQGPKVAEFERAFAARHEVRHAVATTSGTTALHLALLALGVGPGDEVVVPSFTWVASVNAVLYCGAIPLLVDVEEDSFNLDPRRVAASLSPRTRAILAVHLFGRCADLEAIRAAAPGIPVVEDAACAVGARHRGRSAGALGDIGAFSFHPRKIVTTGEGGMVTTDDDGLAEKVRCLRNHGASAPAGLALPEFDELGFNYRMTDLQAAVGLVQLGKLDALLSERRRWADGYRRALEGIPWLRPPALPPDGEHSFQSYVCWVDEDAAPLPRDGVMEALRARGVASRPGTHAVHTLAYHARRFGLRPEDLPVSWRCARQTLSIPLHNRMTARDHAHVVRCLRDLSGA